MASGLEQKGSRVGSRGRGEVDFPKGNRSYGSNYINSGIQLRSRGSIRENQRQSTVASAKKRASQREGSHYDEEEPEVDSQYGNKLYKLEDEPMEDDSQSALDEEPNDSYELQDAVSDDDDNLNIARNLSYKKVKKHIYDNHPFDRQTGDRFKWYSADISYFPCCCSSLTSSPKWVTECAKEIGLGPAIFLMTQKAFSYLFLLFFLLNLPLLFFYQRGITSSQKGEDVPISH